MDVLFVTTTEYLKLNRVTNGTMLLATKLLQAGFDTDILRFAEISDLNKNYQTFIASITQKILARKPKCVSFYTLWPYYHVILRIARQLKERDPKLITVLGGPQASATAQDTMDAMPFVDYICTGEGENTVVPFFNAVLHGGDLDVIPGLFYRRNGVVIQTTGQVPLCDLNTLPYWDDRLITVWDPQQESDIRSKDYLMTIDAGRGCPFSCTFCCTSHFWKRTYRLKTAERIISEIEHWNQKYGIRSFRFSHDAFTVNNKLVTQVCDHIIETGLDITWRCTTRINCITKELLLKMKQAGLTSIEVGIESGSSRMQKLINKKLDLDKAWELLCFMQEIGLEVIVFFMHGFPEETEDDLNQTLEYMFSTLDIGVSRASMNLCSFNPQTALTKKYFDQLVLDPDIKILSRRNFGYPEELEVIKSNKALFPFFHHLDTPLRNEFKNLYYIEWLYEGWRESMYFLRKFYAGDNLQFCRDFFSNNAQILSDTEAAIDHAKHHGRKLLDNTIKDMTQPWVRQLKALFRFNENLHRAKNSKADIILQEAYDFSYLDYHRKLPIEKFSNYKTKLLIQKTGGKLTVNMLDIQPLD